MFDVEKVRKDCVRDEPLLAVTGTGDGRGHFIVEEAPDEMNAEIERFLSSVA